MKKTLPVFAASQNLHAGEFTHEHKLYCAARVPTVDGWEWTLEVKNAPRNVDGGWERIPAIFHHNAKQSTLDVLFNQRTP